MTDRNRPDSGFWAQRPDAPPGTLQCLLALVSRRRDRDGTWQGIVQASRYWAQRRHFRTPDAEDLPPSVRWLAGNTEGAPVQSWVALPPGNYLIGRGRSCDIRLICNIVSRHHAVLEVMRDGGVTLSDLGSTNGTLVFGRRIDNIALNDPTYADMGPLRLLLCPSVLLQSSDAAPDAPT